MKNKKSKINTLFFKIIFVVIIGVICVSCIISYITINMSRDIFEKTYIEAENKIAGQINERLYNFNREAVELIDSINSNKATRLHFTEDKLDNIQSFNNIYNMQVNIKSILEKNAYKFDVLIVGLDGKTYFNKMEILKIEPNDLFKMDISQNTLKNNNKILYQYLDKGITSVTKDYPVIIISKPLTFNTKQQYGIVYLMIKESEFQKIYDYFSKDLSEVAIVNDNNIVLSSNNKKYLGNKVNNFADKIHEEDKGKNIVYKNNGNIHFTQNILGSNLVLNGIININKTLEEIYDVSDIIFICLIITLIIVIIIFFIVKKVTKPLYTLIKKMENLKMDKVDEHVEIEDTSNISEIQQLTTSYNLMITDINSYIKELLKTQKEKRIAEINALQMQINPHYVFNTLSSIKWLMWQGNNEKSIEMINSFIILLRNTISKTDEFITIKEEIDNLKHYILIANARYGDRINVEYYIMPDCYDCFIPKLILQPFIENSFFHGFPTEEEGRIEIFIRQYEEFISIKINDNGIGIENERLEELKKFNASSNKGFGGIGIKNVNDRIKLIYGYKYGIEVKSKLGKGTEIIIIIPKKIEL